MSSMLKDLAHQFLLPLWQQRSLSVIDQFVIPTAPIETSIVKGAGPSALKHYVQKTFKAFSSFEFSLEETIVHRNQTIFRWKGVATHAGEILNIIPTGRKVYFSGMGLATIQAGKLSQYACYTDLSRALQEPDPVLAEAPLTDETPPKKELLASFIREKTGKKLTCREIECLSLWFKGCSIKETARLLGGLSSRTIQTFRENIKRKLNVDTYQQLLQLLHKSGAFDLLFIHSAALK